LWGQPSCGGQPSWWGHTCSRGRVLEALARLLWRRRPRVVGETVEAGAAPGQQHGDVGCKL